MVSKFDDKVEFAIRNLWYNADIDLLDESIKGLRDAANLGDGDAYYFLGRCYMGSAYVNPILGLETDRKFAFECFTMSINLDSDIGKFATMNIEGFSHPDYISKKKIWNEVAKKAYSGNIFCKYLLANAYYYGTITDYKSDDDSQYEWDAGALQLYEECAEAGLSIAIPNLASLLTSGRNGEPVQLDRAREYLEQGSELKSGICERMLGNIYAKQHNGKKALEMYEKALEHMDYYAYYFIGKLYTYHGALGIDLDKAKEYFTKGYELYPDNAKLCNRLGEIYFYGDKDYEKAYYYLRKAYSLGNNWGADILGTCYLYGLGTPIDTNRAKALFSQCPKKRLSNIGLQKLSNHQ